jgi:cobalt-zinc-cadmium resistance protein CzcA
VLKSILAFGLTRPAIVILALLVFIGGGLIAFYKLNIEAYPNPAPVILEITAQAPGLSAEEMERYYTKPMEVGIYTTPGIANIRSTSFYGLTFLSVTFNYGVDRHFAYTQTLNSIQQNVSLPGGQQPQIQQSSLVGEVYRYTVTGPKDFGITNLRTVQDWIVLRRLYTVSGVVQTNSFGGPTKEFEVEVDPNKLQAYNVTLPQLTAALGNANVAASASSMTAVPTILLEGTTSPTLRISCSRRPMAHPCWSRTWLGCTWATFRGSGSWARIMTMMSRWRSWS